MMNSNSTAGQPGNFSRTIRALQRIESLRQRVDDARDTHRLELKNLLVARFAKHEELFADLTPDYRDSFPSIDARREYLSSWRIEGADLVAELSSSFRGERHDREVQMPTRYLQDDGGDAMSRDTQVLRDERHAQARIAKETALQEERDTLQRLLQKHPDLAPVASHE